MSDSSEDEDMFLGGLVPRASSPPRRLLLLTSLSVIGGFLFGYDTGVVSGAMVLVAPALHLSPAWHSAIVSATVLTAAASSLAAGPMMEGMGRRPCILLASLAFFLGSLAMAAVPGKGLLLLGRAVVGVGVGLGSTAVPLYLGECTTPGWRGVAVTSNQVAITFGQLAAGLSCGLLGGRPEGWRWMLGLAALPAALQAAGMLAMPESPRLLIAWGRREEAAAVLATLRPPRHSVMDEVEEIAVASRRCEAGGLGAVLRQPLARKALLLGCLLQAVQQLAGINTVMYYSGALLQRAGAADQLAIWLVAVTAAINFLASLLGLRLVQGCSRRSLLLSSLLLVCLALLLTAASFPLVPALGPGPTLAALCLYLLAFGPGLGPLPWTINSELHPPWCRASSIALATTTNWLANLLVSATFLPLISSLGEAPTFLCYCGVTLVGSLLLHLHLPETKDLPLEAVEELLASKGHPHYNPLALH